MQNMISGLKRSASVKALVIGGLILVLLIPVSMIKGVIHDRDYVHQQARADIMRSWGNEQLVAGPVLVVPYTETHINAYGHQVIEESRAYVLPSRLEYRTETSPEVRYRGIHKVPIYTARLEIRGEFPALDAEKLGLVAAVLNWEKAEIALTVTDARAIAETPVINIGGEQSRFGPGGVAVLKELPAPIVAPAGELFADGAESARFSMELRVKGSDALRILPLGDTTIASMTSSWPNPSFIGNYLPESREISDDGFTADWRVASLGRSLPSQWTGEASLNTHLYSAAFGVNFYMPVSLYQTTLRASKYAVLFIGLSFVAYFLFEIMANLRLHPLQYLLVGFANALFYLLLLSFAEHMSFGLAYALSAAASTTLIAGYSIAVLGNRMRGVIMTTILTVLYAFLYMTLKAENYALLGGAIGLWVALALIMYLTRRIDWYSYSNRAKAS
ncbi:MAG: cell envelope integrity protein CreD [Woeseiaceae bacterium]|nr:cell envelope integrity protein CreD [Woeseiaceae bacterium]